MIITLTKADFSASNIGTLSTWSILKTLGTGATSSNAATYVDRSAAYSTVITIADGYEIGSAGVTVTMGGAAVDYTTGTDSNGLVTITISISAVTGNVVIKVPTVNTSTGEEDNGSEDSGDTTSNVVFDFDFTTNTLSDYSSQGIFTVPDTSTIDTITYDSTYGANLNSNLPYGLTLVNPIDASKAWTLEFTALFVTPTVLAGNRRALVTGIDAIAPFIVINASTVDNLGFQISNGSHSYVANGQLIYDTETSYKITHDGSGNIVIYQNDTSLATLTKDFTDKQFGTILGVLQGGSTAYTWQDVETDKKSYLHKMKFYYN